MQHLGKSCACMHVYCVYPLTAVAACQCSASTCSRQGLTAADTQCPVPRSPSQQRQRQQARLARQLQQAHQQLAQAPQQAPQQKGSPPQPPSSPSAPPPSLHWQPWQGPQQQRLRLPSLMLRPAPVQSRQVLWPPQELQGCRRCSSSQRSSSSALLQRTRARSAGLSLRLSSPHMHPGLCPSSTPPQHQQASPAQQHPRLHLPLQHLPPSSRQTATPTRPALPPSSSARRSSSRPWTQPLPSRGSSSTSSWSALQQQRRVQQPLHLQQAAQQAACSCLMKSRRTWHRSAAAGGPGSLQVSWAWLGWAPLAAAMHQAMAWHAHTAVAAHLVTSHVLLLPCITGAAIIMCPDLSNHSGARYAALTCMQHHTTQHSTAQHHNPSSPPAGEAADGDFSFSTNRMEEDRLGSVVDRLVAEQGEAAARAVLAGLAAEYRHLGVGAEQLWAAAQRKRQSGKQQGRPASGDGARRWAWAGGSVA
jgi:hypothetical protein